MNKIFQLTLVFLYDKNQRESKKYPTQKNVFYFQVWHIYMKNIKPVYQGTFIAVPVDHNKIIDDEPWKYFGNDQSLVLMIIMLNRWAGNE